MPIQAKRISVAIAAALVLMAIPATLQAQLPGFGGGGGGPRVEAKAYFAAEPEGGQGRLFITAKIADGAHIYSLTQKSGGPSATSIKVDLSDSFRITGPFVTHDPPKVHKEAVWGDLLLEEHHGTVTWSAPVELAKGIDPEALEIAGAIDALACDPMGCTPVELTFVAKYDPEAALAKGEYRAEDSNVLIRGHIEPATANPGQKVRLVLTAQPEPDWHLYALADQDNSVVGQGKPTLIALDCPADWKTSVPVASQKPSEGKADNTGVSSGAYYNGAVTWTTEITLPEGIRVGKHELSGLIGYQVCSDTGCQPPLGARFTAMVEVGDKAGGKTPLVFQPAKYGEVALVRKSVAAAAPVASIAEAEPVPFSTILWALPFAFLGGLILNLMPCVLPVIGLKILSFVEQAGHNRREILSLNLWYSAGVLSVFIALASVAVGLNLSWGEQFQSAVFNLVLIGVLFSMALSFLGVWEIPIPGFVGSGKANDLALREGPLGAFSKGLLSTVLATPCSGPALGAVFALTLRQPPAVTYLLFVTIGLGMALPYLMIGAFPQMVRILPKPGVWMETFKQAMGFVLLGAVVVMFKFFVKAEYLIPALGLLVGLGLACWWVGRTPLYAGASKLVKAWSIAVVLGVVVGGGSFSLLLPRDTVLNWEPFSRSRLEELTAAGQTVMIDFTANWCLTCQMNYALAIDTPEVRSKVEANRVTPLLADWTDRNDAIKQMLQEMGSNSIPLLAIFPANRPHEPIILRDIVSQRQVLEALEQAGPSSQAGPPQPSFDQPSTAMR